MSTALALVASHEPRTLEAIEADISREFAEIAHLTKTVKATRLHIRARAVHLGGFLEEMKARLKAQFGHGHFEAWREARGYPSSTATRYMRIFRHRNQIHRLADLTIEQADRIAREIEQVTTESGS